MMDLLLIDVVSVLVWRVLSWGWVLGCVKCCFIMLARAYSGWVH